MAAIAFYAFFFVYYSQPVTYLYTVHRAYSGTVTASDATVHDFREIGIFVFRCRLKTFSELFRIISQPCEFFWAIGYKVT